MGKLRGYVSQIDQSGAAVGGREANVSDFGGGAVIELGKAVQSAGQNAGTASRIILQNKARQEITQADTAFAQMNADLTIELQDRVKNWKPGDPDLTETFPSAVKDRLASIGQDRDGASIFETGIASRHFDSKAAVLASQFTVETAKAQAHLDGLQAIADHGKLIDVNSNLVSRYPAYFESTRQDIHDIINNPNGVYGRVSAVDREKLLRKGDELLAMAAAYGQIRQAPKRAQELLAQGWLKDYIPGDKMASVLSHADTAVHAIGIEERQAAEAERAAARDLSHKVDTGLVTQRAAHDADPKSNPDVTPTTVLDAMRKGLDPRVGFTWLNMLDMEARQGGRPIKTDRGVENDLFARIHARPGDPNKITDTGPIYAAYLKNQLSDTARRDLVKELTDARDPEGQKLGTLMAEFLDSRKSSITHANQLLGKLDPEGDTKFGDYRFFIRQKIQQYEKEGKDPFDLFNPSKPDFVGKPELMGPYQKSMQDSINSIVKGVQKGNAPAPLPEDQVRKPGETFEQWKARQK